MHSREPTANCYLKLIDIFIISNRSQKLNALNEIWEYGPYLDGKFAVSEQCVVQVQIQANQGFIFLVESYLALSFFVSDCDI